MTLKCPNCGQLLKSEPGKRGMCPYCKTEVVFPDGDPMLGELITCPHCGQNQRYRDGLCISCGKKMIGGNDPGESIIGKPVKKKSHPFRTAIIVILILFILAQCGRMVGKGDGSSCYICGDPSVYTTDSGYGLCGRHLLEGLDYID